MHSPNNRATEYVKLKLLELKGEIEKSTVVVVGDFNTPPSAIDKTIREKIGKGVEELNNTMNKRDLTDLYRMLSPTIAHTHCL